MEILKRENIVVTLMKNDENELFEFLLQNGKNPKPVSPVCFIEEEENDEKEKES